MSLTRRQFIWTAAASTVGCSRLLYAQGTDAGDASGIFRHGVASGDPLSDRVVLWTRVTPSGSTQQPIDVDWRIATDSALERVVARGSLQATAERDFTVKVDASGLDAGRVYYYAFTARGERSPVGRTKTLPAGAVSRLLLASVCCSNYPAGFFNVYRCLANRHDLDAVIHLGDYIYEFQNGVFGDGSGLLRIPEPRREAVTLSDYRIRYATYRTDPDLQAAHHEHAFIAVWDDHEMTNDAWAGGAANHNPDQGEGDWTVRQAAAYRAYLEWMPVREAPGPGIRLYRPFRFGTLADLFMLDTRSARDKQAASADVAALAAAGRSILGADQEAWLFEELRASQGRGTAWQLLGQQVMFSPIVPRGRSVLSSDTWDGYPAARDRILEYVARNGVRNLAILSGDMHSSWAFDVPRDPWSGYQAATGGGSLAVEILAPAISSPPLFDEPGVRERAPLLRPLLPHLKFLDGENRGYVLLDITAARLQAEWFFVPSVKERSPAEIRAAAFVCERGSSRLTPA